jgi:hypothetical protein
LHALDVTTGLDQLTPVIVVGSVSSLHGPVNFDASKACQRPGLLLSNGTLFVAFGSNGCDNAHGWVFAYNPATLAQIASGVFNTSPNQTKQGGIWQGGSGLAADAAGNVFFITANGTFDVNMGGSDFGDTFLKLTLGSGGLGWTDYFTPFDQANMAAHDLDLGSGGVMLLSDPTWAHANEAIGAGKTGTIYVVDRDNMGHYLPTDNSQIVQSLQSVLNEVDGSPAYWNNMVYFAPDHQPAVAYLLTGGLLSSVPVAQTQAIIPVGGPVVSSNGNSNGVVWIVRNFGLSAAQLSAFDGTSMHEIYNTTQVGSRDTLGSAAHFVVPTIANGKAFVGTQTQLVVYGLLPPISAVSGNHQTGAAGSPLPVPLTVQVTDAYSGAPIVGVRLSFSGKGSFGTPNPVTDSTGTASTTYTLPTTFTSSTVTITVSSQGYASTTFSETVTAASPASISPVSGGSQSGTVGTTLPAQLVFKVADQFGNAVPGASVTFSDNPNHGGFSSNPAITDATGRARVAYTLPTKAGFTRVTPSIGSLTGTGVQEQALAASPASVAVVSGNNQTAHRNTTLPKPLVVRVADQFNNPVSGVSVTYTDNGANGVLGGNPATTNSGGQASVTYTTSATAGTVTIDATVPGLTAAAFTVRVTN